MTRDWASAPLAMRASFRLLDFFFRRVWGLRVEGLENVPLDGPVILSGNHVALVDGPLLAVAVGGRRFMRGLGKREIFMVPVVGWYLRKIGSIPVDRRGDLHAMRAALAVLKGGGCLAVMPEGTRSKDGRPLPPKAGVGFLAAHAKAQVVPARLENTAGFPWARPLTVRFGAPLRFEGRDAGREECLTFARAVMDRVFSL